MGHPGCPVLFETLLVLSSGCSFIIFSSPEPSGSQGELILYPCSDVCCCPSTIYKDLQNPWPMKAKFHVEPAWEGGMKVYIIGPGHMTKMAAMPIYGKHLLPENKVN